MRLAVCARLGPRLAPFDGARDTALDTALDTERENGVAAPVPGSDS